MIDDARLVAFNTIFATLAVLSKLGSQEDIDLRFDIVRVVFGTLNEDADMTNIQGTFFCHSNRVAKFLVGAQVVECGSIQHGSKYMGDRICFHITVWANLEDCHTARVLACFRILSSEFIVVGGPQLDNLELLLR